MIATIWLFIAVAIAVNGAYFLLEHKKRRAETKVFQRRIQATSGSDSKQNPGDTPALIKTEQTNRAWLARYVLGRLKVRHRLQGLLDQAGLRWNVGSLIHVAFFGALTSFFAFWLLAPPPFYWLGIPAGLAAGFLPIWYVRRKANKRLQKFEEQFPEGLEFVSRSMRAGHAFSVALDMLHREFENPMASEFRRTFDEQNLGLPLDIALEKLSGRIPLLDVQFFVSAVLLQKRTGGNLAEILDKMAFLIRERYKLRGKIRAVTAHGRMTGKALSMIPVGVGGVMFYVNPTYAEFFFTDPLGQGMLAGAIGLQVIGYLVIQKIVSIEV